MKRGISFLLGTGLVASMVLTAVPAQTGSYFGTQAVYAEASARSVETFEELLAAFDATWDADEGEMVVTLTGDIEQGEGDYLDVHAGWTVTLNLAGHKLVLRNDGPRGLRNHGTLTVTGDGVVTNGTEVNTSYGLIDNYGVLTIESGRFVDYGEGDGSSIKNRLTNGSRLTVKNGVVFEGEGVNTGNAAIYSDGYLVVEDNVKITTKSNRAYGLIVNTGEAVIGETVGAIENPVIVAGTHGGIGVNGGNVTINNGKYSCKNYYGIWITNNDGETNVDIKYGEFMGKLYGLRAGVDDGHQDASDADIVVEGGKFYGETKGAVAMNDDNSEREWGLTILGGEFSSEPAHGYIKNGYDIYQTSDGTYGYVVDELATVAILEKVVLFSGETHEVSLGDKAKYATVTVDDSGILAVDGRTLTAGETAGEANYYVNYGGLIYPQTTTYDAKVITRDNIEIVPDENTGKDEEERTEMVGYVTEQLVDLLEKGESVNGAVSVNSLEALKLAIANGETLEFAVVNDWSMEDEEEAKEWLEKETLEEIGENEKIAVVHSVDLYFESSNGTVDGWVYQTDTPVKVKFLVPEHLRTAPAGFARSFSVIYEHYDMLTGEYTSGRLESAVFDGEYVEAETDKFSAFVVVYEDVPEAEAPNTGMMTSDGSGAEHKMKFAVMMLAVGMVVMGSGMMMEGKNQLAERER